MPLDIKSPFLKKKELKDLPEIYNNHLERTQLISQPTDVAVELKEFTINQTPLIWMKIDLVEEVEIEAVCRDASMVLEKTVKDAIIITMNTEMIPTINQEEKVDMNL
jgi:hypothetical protein